MKKFKVIILSGGKGARVKKYTKKIPKCLIEINGKPFLYRQLEYLKKNNIKDVIVSVNYLGGKIKSYLKKNIDFINTKIVNDGKKPLGTGGAIIKSLPFGLPAAYLPTKFSGAVIHSSGLFSLIFD